ncbi:MAG: 6-carboxytetrahydropterin synthase [Pseudomonadota bacterium]
MSFIFRLKKETFKFSCTHFTIFGATEGEKMHGHNYHVQFDLHFADISKTDGMAVDFNVIKPIIKELCDELDEHILIAKNSPYTEIKMDGGQVDIKFNQKHYSLPKEDVKLLPVLNISSEELARFMTEKFVEQCPKDIGLQKVEATIEETRGQGVSYSFNL